MKIRVAINGFGKIGRQLARLIFSIPSLPIELVAVNSLDNIREAAFLLKHDSCHGTFSPDIKIVGQHLQVQDQPAIPFYNNPDPAKLPWQNDIDIVIECSGKFTNNDTARGHLKSGAKKVIITAAAANAADITLCYGVNHDDYKPNSHQIISASSCTTNCIAPIINILNNHFGFVSGMATFLHSYTNGQPLIDATSKDLRRSRNAATNIIPTSTSAEEQVPLIIPATKNRFKAIAIRIPTPVVHLGDLTVKLSKKFDRADIIKSFKQEQKHQAKDIISISTAPLVSIDYRNSVFSATIDSLTLKTYGDIAKILVWHDNEYSYSRRIIDLITHIGSRL